MNKRVVWIVAGVVVVAVAAAVVMWWPDPAESVADRPEGGRTADVELPTELPALPPQLDRTIELAKRPKGIETGGYVNVRAANTMRFYAEQEALPTEHDLQNLHTRQQIFRVVAVDGRTLTLDKPLEYDVPVDSTSDGSEEIEGKVYESKVAPLVDPVLGVGIENLFLTQVVNGHKTSEAAHEYGNIAPAEAMHGIVFKWAVNGWVRGVTTYFTGSHPVVTEEARNLEIVGNRFVGSWNKGKGGNGYLRGSRVWDSVYAGDGVDTSVTAPDPSLFLVRLS